MATSWCYVFRILAGKYQATKELVVQAVKVILKGIPTKRINILKATGMDENTISPSTMLFQRIDQLMGGRAIKITH
ncbi:MAG: hypothetical protein OS130_03880 [Thermodesulfobacteriota bacterium]|nr:MAG: hypothetical protein OS130_03880 [Thermodesulfobacteriota bacterium]